ncbi:MAG: hypothetical protein LBC26_06685 [Oscillospiraceae bacterium]|jgi:hypothetical protein|nr:hypothetical protein [Oscillospiraceae bacterium]
MIKLFRAVLTLFDGGGEGGGTAAAAAPAAPPAAPAAPAAKGGKSGGTLATVVYGKQAPDGAGEADTQAPDAGETQQTQQAKEGQKPAFQDLIRGEYKADFEASVQTIIDRRFRETKETAERLQAQAPVIQALMQRYGVADMQALQKAVDQDDSYWSAAAEAAGMTVQQYRTQQRLEAEKAQYERQVRTLQAQMQAQQQVQQWEADAQQVKSTYPDFDLATETKNPEFTRMLRSGIPVQHAYEVLHREEIMARTVQATQAQVAKQVQTRGQRPAEAGASPQSAFIVKSDVSKLTKADRAEIARRALRGEQIRF